MTFIDLLLEGRDHTIKLPNLKNLDFSKTRFTQDVSDFISSVEIHIATPESQSYLP